VLASTRCCGSYQSIRDGLVLKQAFGAFQRGFVPIGRLTVVMVERELDWERRDPLGCSSVHGAILNGRHISDYPKARMGRSGGSSVELVECRRDRTDLLRGEVRGDGHGDQFDGYGSRMGWKRVENRGGSKANRGASHSRPVGKKRLIPVSICNSTANSRSPMAPGYHAARHDPPGLRQRP